MTQRSFFRSIHAGDPEIPPATPPEAPPEQPPEVPGEPAPPLVHLHGEDFQALLSSARRG